MIRLLLARHGETNAPPGSLKSETVSLSEQGFKEARALAQRVKAENIDVLLASPFTRCQEVAGEISKVIGLPIDTVDCVGKKVTGADWDALGPDFDNRHCPGGESLQDVLSRANEFWNDVQQFEGKTVLVVSHATFLRVFLGMLLKLSLWDSIFSLRIDHCGLSEVIIENKEKFVVKVVNEHFFTKQ